MQLRKARNVRIPRIFRESLDRDKNCYKTVIHESVREDQVLFFRVILRNLLLQGICIPSLRRRIRFTKVRDLRFDLRHPTLRWNSKRKKQLEEKVKHVSTIAASSERMPGEEKKMAATE